VSGPGRVGNQGRIETEVLLREVEGRGKMFCNELGTDRAEEVRTAYLGRSQCEVGMSFS
jgi:hypothetical protein